MGVESIELDTVNLRMVARTLPGKQFEVGRRLRVLVVRALRRAGIVSPTDGTHPMVEAIVHPATAGGAEEETQGTAGAEEVTSWLTARLGRMRVSTVVLIVAFFALFWVYHNFEPRPAPARRRRRGRPARLRARPQLHLGAADQRAAGPRSPRPPPRPRPARRRPRRHRGRPPARRRRPTTRGSWAAGAADRHADAHPHADDAVGARVGTGADHAGSAELAISGFRRRHRYTGVP